MYDLPVLRPATDAFWAALREALTARGIADAPVRLRRDLEPERLWTHPDLLIAQACGLPLVTVLDRRVRYVATPIYAVPGCAGGDYRSWLVVRCDSAVASIADLRGGVAAVNARQSHSGANALLALTADVAGGRPFLADILLTGAHAASLEAVRDGRAAGATIDCVTWHHLGRRAQAGLRIAGATPRAPALPYITAADTDDATLRQLQDALGSAIETAREPCRRLALAGVRTDGAAYARIRTMLAHGLRHGCARLATVMHNPP